MLVTVIVPAYNEEKLIGGCLESVMKNSGNLVKEIIVIDNASSDRTGEIAAKRTGVRVIREDIKGLTHARERGPQEATAEFIAYLDADSRLPTKWSELVEKAFKENPEPCR